MAAAPGPAVAAEIAQAGAEESAPGTPAPQPDGPPALISADMITYDEDLGVVTATGNVEISQDERVLTADNVSYNQRTNLVSASGNVRLLEPSGEVFFAEYAEITGDLREAFIRDIRVLLSDRSRIAAASGVRTGGNRTEFKRAVFSPCELCRDDPDRAPLWQLKADRVVHDQEDQSIRYSNMRLEFYGIPIAYTPYFEHPDPVVERKTGFLAPTIGVSDSLGFVMQTPYHWVIDSNVDVTFEPLFVTDQRPVLAGEYRQLFPFGQHEFELSGTVAERERNNGTTQSNALRGHIDAEGNYDIDETWRSGFDINLTSDDTYLRRYNFGSERFLTSNVFGEGFWGRDYAAANVFGYQGLRESDETGETPIVAPLLDYSFLSEPWIADSTYWFDTNLLVLTRTDGRDTRRISAKGGWSLPFMDPIGGAYTLSASLQLDGYWTNDFDESGEDLNPSGSQGEELNGRFFPQIALGWRYPWVSQGETFSQLFEPLAQVVAGTDKSDQDRIPNEDSLDFEFDEANLFSLNRFPGEDRVDPGQRVDYGLQWKAFGAEGQLGSVFVGQSFRLQDQDDLFAANSGVRDRLSDVVGRISVDAIENVDLLYRFRIDKDNFEPRRQEVDLQIGPPALNLDLRYLFVDTETGAGNFETREEVDIELRSRLNENWSIFGSHRRDLEENDALRTAIGLTYQDECFLIEAVGQRRFFRDREVEPDDSIFVRVVLKHLGGFGIEQ